MSCEKFDAYETGSMTSREFAEHARGCAACAALAALDGRLDKELIKMREPVQASGLWERIETALAEEISIATEPLEVRPAGRRAFAVFTRRPRPILVAAYAAALAILVLGGAYLVFMKPLSSPGILAQRALAKVELKEKEYADAIQALEKQARPKIEAMDLQMISLYRDKLATIDSQIEKCREALSSNPANAHIRSYLLAALQDKRQTLTDALGSTN